MRLARTLALAAMAATLGGCPWMFPFGHDDRGDDLVDDTALDQDPHDDCDDRLQDCLAAGTAPEACESEHDACVGQPGDPCEERLDACLRAGEDPMVCRDAYQACVGDPATDPCQDAYRQCLASNEDPDVCAERLLDCQGGGAEDPLAACERLRGECLSLGFPEDYCATQHDACVEAVQPARCASLYDSCVALGLPEDFCVTERDACLGTPDTDVPPDTDAPSDPSTGTP